MKSFNELGLGSEIYQAIEKLGFKEPTQIQAGSIPKIMSGDDVIGESATGSGKTLAFGCGIIQHTMPKAGIQALVLTPTRELAEQVKGSLKEFSSFKNLRIMAVYGGVSINPQIEGLTRADVVVATPGRLLDHLERRTIDLSRVSILVLDEADRMFDMGFIDDVERIIRACPKKRQTLCFSATISPDIKRLANRYMKEPNLVSAVKQVDPSKLSQCYYDVVPNKKLSLLTNLLEDERSGLVMVFCNTRKTTDFVVKNLKANRVSAIAIHGGLSQNKRENTMDMFNNAKFGVLVCTDVAARGLHIDNVSHVYNYELPSDPKDYVHRIGRTARAGESGKVINLLCSHDHDNFTRILREYDEFAVKKMQMPQLRKIVVKMQPQRIAGRSSRPMHGSRGSGPMHGNRRRWS
ncbi:DEAD/DEAH box helicase [Candidatus Woesearchaeota archaeon]|nr:DEAD/DEAH box helicase [Candidatus Woesearchaeota archaeon]